MKYLSNIARYLFLREIINICPAPIADSDASNILSVKDDLEILLKSSSIEDSMIAISSNFNDFGNIDQKVKAVNKIMHIGEEVYPLENVHTYNRLGIYEFLINLSTNSDVQQYVNGILGPLYKTDKSLYDTLFTYLQENGNSSKTAEKLFVNRRTITYRLQKIEELLGIDLNNSESRFILQFCLKIKELN